MPLGGRGMILETKEAVLPPTYTAYSYSYPHKSSYRPLDPPVRLSELWSAEDRRSLFLYLHVPFCEMRCGFCNLFAASQPEHALVDEYLEAVTRQARTVGQALAPARFASVAIGGGTPTFLNPEQLRRLLGVAEESLGVDLSQVPVSVETSPKTADLPRMQALARGGVSRVSMGVQSFVEADTRALGRPQQAKEVYRALETIRSVNIPILNIDLIYGAAGQTEENWLYSVREALRFAPEELYLYPLYVRPQTGLAQAARTTEHQSRIGLYRAARCLLLESGYMQQSMRAFSRIPSSDGQGAPPSADYSCQRDGMVGLGCGARSYTTHLHYSSRFQVRQAAIREALSGWIAASDEQFGWATHGVRLSPDERRRRYLIMSLLQRDGLDMEAYTRQFGTRPADEFPLLLTLEERGLAVAVPGRLQLTEAGLEQSDAIGPALYSAPVQSALQEFAAL